MIDKSYSTLHCPKCGETYDLWKINAHENGRDKSAQNWVLTCVECGYNHRLAFLLVDKVTA